jgi:membrane protease YdiL (CAAX protease family)
LLSAIYALAVAFVQLTLLVIGVRRYRSLTPTEKAATESPTRFGIVAICSAVLIAYGIGGFYAALHAAAVRHLLLPHPQRLDLRVSPIAVASWALRDVLLIGVAPIAEESFFRGWLFAALAEFWRPVFVMLVTGFLWWLAHVLRGPAGFLFLLPSAIVLTLARHYGGNPRASWIVHVVNNAMAVVFLDMHLFI